MILFYHIKPPNNKKTNEYDMGKKIEAFVYFLITHLPLMLMTLGTFASIFLPFSVQAKDFQSCKNCHKTTLNKDNSGKYLHSPFAEGECEECHKPPAELDKSSVIRNQQKIIWLADSAVEDTNQAFVLPGDKLGATLVVELYGTDGEISRHIIDVPPRADLTEVEDSGTNPTITNIQVLEVKRGVLLKAIVGWQTDTLSDAAVRYGLEELSQTTGPSKRLAKHHQVTLSDLKPDRTYHFAAISSDVFGRSQVSKTLTFSTSDFSTVNQLANTSELSKNMDRAVIASHFQKFGSDYLVELTFKKPSSVAIGISDEQRCFPNDESHADLSCEMMRSVELCLECHNAHLHPVNVSPTKPGTIIPPEFPTLPGGRITCISCHTPHSSNYAYFLRRSDQTGLCVSCHQNQK